MADNPLLRDSSLPHGAPPLGEIKPEHFPPALQDGIAKARAKVAAIRDNAAAPTFENTIEALEFAKQPLSRVANIYTNFVAVKNSGDLMELGGAFRAEVSKYQSDIMTDAALFARVKAVYDAKDALSLDAEQQMLLKRTYQAFVRSGALLNDNEKAALRDIDARIAEVTTQYNNNIVKSVGAYKKVITDEDELAGVPERVKSAYRQAAEEEGLIGQFVIRLLPPPYDLLAYADSRALRKEIHEAMGAVACAAETDNRPVLMEIVRLRHEKAQILGYKNYAEFVLEDRMAKDPDTVVKFLADAEKVYRPAAEAQLKKVADLAAASDGLPDFAAYEFQYYNRKLQEETFKLNIEDLRPYFELENTVKGLHAHIGKLFGVTIAEKTADYSVHNPGVKVYEIADRQSGEILGVMYTDYYARPGGKNSGAWMDVFRDRGIYDGKSQPAVVINCLNLAPPTPDTPSLLSLDDVRTLFHEFGHGMHGILARGKYPSQNGINVKWDFIELPSQLQENWVLQPEVLATFAQHYETGEALDPALMKKAIGLETFNAAYAGMRMNYRAMLDMTWYTADPATIKSVAELEKGVIEKDWIFPPGKGSPSASFDHIFSGGADYAAGYYSYKWAEVLDADIFEAFREKGLYDAETAKRLRDVIYAKGATAEPMELFKEMMGREPQQDALFRREGLLPEKKPREGKPPSAAFPRPPRP